MATIDSPTIISTILANNCTYQGDPPCHSILSYTNDLGGRSWALTYSQSDEDRYFNSPSVRAITYLFLNGELTKDGLVHLMAFPQEPTNSKNPQ